MCRVARASARTRRGRVSITLAMLIHTVRLAARHVAAIGTATARFLDSLRSLGMTGRAAPARNGDAAWLAE
jgi:hypothetical protein